MRVRVKENQKVYIYNKLYKEGQEFTLVDVHGLKDWDGQKGKPLHLTPENQFSASSMELVDPNDAPRVAKKLKAAAPESIKEYSERKPLKAPAIPEVK